MQRQPLLLSEKGIQESASLLYAFWILKRVLTRAGTESPWLVRCGPPDAVFLECLEIDPESGKITELK
jgi:hypothetical protein